MVPPDVSMKGTMNDSQWDAKFKSFLKKTGEDFKRFGAEVKTEAQKLMTDVKDPERQEELREGLKNIGVWARKAADDAASLMETGVKKAEGALNKASGKVNEFVAKPVAGAPAAPPPAATPPSPPPVMDEAPAPTPRAKKTVGKAAPKKKAAAPAGGAAKKPAARKTIGRPGTK